MSDELDVLLNIIHETLVVKVDCIVRKDSPYRLAEFERRRRVAIGDTSVWMVAAEDLVLSKLDWARDSRSALQLGDVRNLIASVETLDWAYIERWAGSWGLPTCSPRCAHERHAGAHPGAISAHAARPFGF